ncbi:MAG: DUF885 domain-containing protein [Chloroflexaceae bacterium]|nr:DUF885 domain-containing protein [Chloroflexaceae bacterium]
MTDYHNPLLTELAERFLREYFAFYPTTASSLGLHEYDGQVSNLRPESIAARVEALHRFQQQLQLIDPASLERLAWFDYELLRWQTHAELWKWTERRDYVRNPMVYTDDMMVDNYVKRNYAPLEVRAEALIRHLHQIPWIAEAARHNLNPTTPQILIEESLPVFDGLVAFMNESLPELFGGDRLPVSHQAALSEARQKAVMAIEHLKTYLKDTLYPVAQQDFAIGPERFSEMLRYHELVELPLERLLAIGEADLARNQAAIEQVAAQIDPSRSVREHMQAQGRNHPTADRLLEETRSLLEHLRDFLIERDLVTLPVEGQCKVEETPPFARWAFAMMDTAGPFEQVATDSFYYVTLPEAHWPPEQVEGWLTKFDYATMTGVSIHEAYPGHYLHFMNVRHAPTRLAKVFDTYSHFESWAHYCEQMMLDQGYGQGDLHLRLSQLSEGLVRDCRYICAIKMHTQGMRVEECIRFFMAHAYMDEVTATREARRGTHDPGYINYTLGKLQLLKLLEDYRAAQGAAFSLKQFHDAYIGYGSPPIPLLRKLLLPHDDGVLF